MRSRIIAFLLPLLLVVQGVGFVLIDAAITSNARMKTRSELETGSRVFERLLQQSRQHLADTVTVLSVDFGFRKAVASNDHPTMVSALDNHGRRVAASVVMLASLDGALIATTATPDVAGRPFPFAALLRAAERKGQASPAASMPRFRAPSPATRCGCARCSRTWSAMRSSSPSAAKWRSASSRCRMLPAAPCCTSPCAIRASASSPKPRRGFSPHSARPTARPRGASAAPAWGLPSANSWSR